MKFKKGDKVKISAGNDKGKEGKILAVFPHEEKIVVEGVNMKKRHVRSRRQGQKGERVEKPAPIPASRAMMICRSCGAPVRIGQHVRDGSKVRVCKSCGKDI